MQQSKDKAKTAVRQIPEIEKLTREAQQKIRTAENALTGAESNAQNAKDTAEDAETKYAQRASEVREHWRFPPF